jgi:YHS domain-containing protein
MSSSIFSFTRGSESVNVRIGVLPWHLAPPVVPKVEVREHTEEKPVIVKDPVCGMGIDPETAAATEDHEGKTYHFCSAACHEKFKAEPGKYAFAE